MKNKTAASTLKDCTVRLLIKCTALSCPTQEAKPSLKRHETKAGRVCGGRGGARPETGEWETVVRGRRGADRASKATGAVAGRAPVNPFGRMWQMQVLQVLSQHISPVHTAGAAETLGLLFMNLSRETQRAQASRHSHVAEGSSSLDAGQAPG